MNKTPAATPVPTTLTTHYVWVKLQHIDDTDKSTTEHLTIDIYRFMQNSRIRL
jgi:hypothetical protein